MNELFELFKKLGYDGLYFRQGSLGNDKWPDNFFTYFNIDTPGVAYRDNKLTQYSVNIVVYFYSNDSEFVYEEMDRFEAEARKNNFIIEGKSHDTPSGRTDYFGRLINIKKLFKEEN